MRIRRLAAKTLIPLLLAVHLAGPAWSQTADDQLEAYLATKQESYRFYRSAWFYLRTGNIDLAALELGSFLQGWNDIQARFAAAPPGPFAEDPQWPETLEEIAGRADAGLTALEAADAEAAKAALAPIPAIMAELRARNGVVTFSDAADNLTQAMESLWQYRHETADFDDPATRTALSEGAERLRAAFDRMRDEAPDDVAFDDQFLRLVSNSDAAVDRLEQAVAAEDQTGLVNALRELRSFERMLWLNFG